MLKYSVLYLISFLGFFTTSFAFDISLKQAVALKYITVEASSNGGYLGSCISVNMENKTNQFLNVYLEPSMVFHPSDYTYQNLVAVGDEVVYLYPQSSTSKVLHTFCGTSSARSPIRGLEYQLDLSSGGQLNDVALYLKQHSFLNQLGQSAIWAVTDNHHLRSIYNSSVLRSSQQELVVYMAGVLGKPVPEYYTEHIEPTNQDMIFNPIVKQYIVELTYDEPKQRYMRVYILKEDGSYYKQVFTEQIDHSKHTVIVKLDPMKIPKGNYIIQLKGDDNRVFRNVEVPVGV